MRYVYDTIIGKEQTKLKFQGATYKLEKRTSMGSKLFYTFTSSGCGSVLVVPYFYELYLAILKKYEKFPKTAPLDKYLARLKKSISEDLEVEEYPSEIHEDGVCQVIYARYKEIELQFVFEDEALRMVKQFRIVENNLTGELVTVSFEEDE